MLTSFFVLALAAAAFADVPTGYRTVYITSKVDATYVVVPKAATNGSAVVVQTRTNKPEQQWYLTAASGNSSVQLANSTLCLDAGAKTNWKDLSVIYVKNCDNTSTSQTWNVQADGRISLAASSPLECVDLQYMRATQNNPVGLYNCAGLNNAGAGDKGLNWPLVNVTA